MDVFCNVFACSTYCYCFSRRLAAKLWILPKNECYNKKKQRATTKGERTRKRAAVSLSERAFATTSSKTTPCHGASSRLFSRAAISVRPLELALLLEHVKTLEQMWADYTWHMLTRKFSKVYTSIYAKCLKCDHRNVLYFVSGEATAKPYVWIIWIIWKYLED